MHLAAIALALLTLTPRDVDEAILIGQSRVGSERARFHASYRFPVARAPIDYIEVITPFRRIVLAAEAKIQAGDRGFGQRQGLELAAASHGQFEFQVELTFHPLNTYVLVPAFEVWMVRGGMRVDPASLDRQPRYGARLEGLPPTVSQPAAGIRPGATQPMLGATLLARFAPETIDAMGPSDLVISQEGKELARLRIDLGKLR
jgi:hypothetical protein